MVRTGRQVLGELSFCDMRRLDDEEHVRTLLTDAARASGATLIALHVHRFQPYGVSGVAILAESHLAVHTWPELAYAAVDAFTCGNHVDPNIAVSVLEKGLRARCASRIELSRGMRPSLPILEQLAYRETPGP